MATIKKPAVRKAIDKVRAASGLPVYDKPLIKGKCNDPKCGRVYQWREIKDNQPCPWNGCTGKVKAE